jgi:diguanylate cyclase (GGDEF)-like protein/PAS domain S-box-containing protein
LNGRAKDLGMDYRAKIFLATFGLILIFAITIIHSRFMDQKISDISKGYLSKITVQNADIISSEIEGKLQTLDVLARMIGSRSVLNKDEIVGIIKNESLSDSVISMGVVLKDGSYAFTPATIGGGKAEDLLLPADWEYIHKTISGYVNLSGAPSRTVDRKLMLVYARPIYHKVNVAGALVVLYNDEFFKNLTFPESVEPSSCSYIAAKNGSLIYHAENNKKHKLLEKLLPGLTDGWSLGGSDGGRLKKDILYEMSGTVRYSKEEAYISYAPIGFRNWYLINLTPSNIAEAQSQSIYGNLVISFIYVLLVLIAGTIYFIYLRNQKIRHLESKIRMQSINDESYRVIMEQTGEIIFEYDTADKTYIHTENFKKNFGYEPTRTGFLGSLEFDYIHPDDVLRFAAAYEGMKENRSLTETEIRIINSEGEYLWTRVFILGVFDKNGKIAKVIGKFVNIDERKREILQLKEKAVMDSATGVYNKQTTEEMIRTFLSGDGKHGIHAVLILDIDDFKVVNDDHGHRLGDAVVSALGLELNRIFRSSDIKGRIGGDEFMILMKDIEGMDFIINKAKHICEMFQDRDIEKNKKINVSTSIGIALYNKDGTTYEELYEAADRALYHCKSIQKGTFSFYDKKVQDSDIMKEAEEG